MGSLGQGSGLSRDWAVEWVAWELPIPDGAETFLFVSDAHHPVHSQPETLSAGVRWWGHDVNQSLPAGAEG